jgi:hypothetical protein
MAKQIAETRIAREESEYVERVILQRAGARWAHEGDPIRLLATIILRGVGGDPPAECGDTRIVIARLMLRDRAKHPKGVVATGIPEAAIGRQRPCEREGPTRRRRCRSPAPGRRRPIG